MAKVDRKTIKGVSERVSKNGVVSWRAQFRIDGRNCQETFDDPDSAYEFKALVDRVGGARAREVLRARHANTRGVPTLREFTERYLDTESGLLTGVEPGTRAAYVTIAEKSFLKILGDVPIDAIDKTDVGRWVSWQEKQPSQRRTGQTLAAKTIRNYHSLLSSVLAAAADAGVIEKNVAYRTRLTRGEKREAVFLSPAEFNTLLHFVPDYYKPLVLFLAGTGLRWGEASALRWGEVDLRATPSTVRVVRAWKKSDGSGPILSIPKTSKSRRTVSMHAALATAIGTPGLAGALVFPNRTTPGARMPYQRFRRAAWDRAVDAAMDRALCADLGLTPLTRRPTPHDLRHTHASWLIAAGVPLPYIQARLGHESITTTVGTYGHLVPDAHEKMSTVIEATLDGVQPAKATLSSPEQLAIEADVDEMIVEFDGELTT